MDTARARGPAHPDPETSADEAEMQIVYVMEVIDPVERQRGAKPVRRFTYETREEAWAKYSDAIRSGFEVYVEEVGRIRGASTWHGHVVRSSAGPTSRMPPDGVDRERPRRGRGLSSGGGDALTLPDR